MNEALISEAFLKIINMSISASWLVLAVVLLRLILKKAPKWISVLLWGFVAIRLICPFSIESVLSLIPSAETVSPDIMMDWTPEISTGIGAVDTVINPIITQTFAPDPATSANPLQILIPVAGMAWLAGIAVMLIYTAISYFLLRRKVATAVLLRNNIYQSENVDSPFVLGILKPKIYLPFRMDGQNLEHVIAHEESHIQRKDHWWKPFGFVLLALHWFNPLMWLGYILLCRDIELACDEKVIKEMDNENRADYTQALVVCSINRRSIAACPLAFGEVGVKERVKSVLHYKKPAFWVVAAAVVTCIAAAVCFLTNPAASVDEKLSVFIDCQIAGHYQSEETYGRASCVNWQVLDQKKRGASTTVYMWVLYEEYSVQGGQLHRERSIHVPSVITAEYEDGAYKLTEYWEPQGCVCDEDVIQEKFPRKLHSRALDPDRYLKEQQQENMEMARDYFHADDHNVSVNHDLLAKSGPNTVPMIVFSNLTDCVDDVYWLTINPDDCDFAPFSIWYQGEEKIAVCAAYDAQTLEPLDYFMPSGLAPHTYLLQSADPDRLYIVTARFSNDEEVEMYAFGVRFGEPAIDPMLTDVVETVNGSRMTYYKKADGTYLADGLTYLYRLEITGRMQNAAMDSTFVYLSNLETITFDQAWKAAGFSSNTEDYFSPDVAVLVDWVHGEATYIKAMNKENVIALSRLGMELTWKDLEPYKGTDVGSGLYVVQYDIDSEFYLQVVDGKTDGVPTSARLYARCTGASCDIRTEYVRGFISRNQDEALDNAICRAILDQNADGTLSYLSLESIPTESHDILAVEEVRGTPLSEQADHRLEITAYIQYVYNRYGYSGGELKRIAGVGSPAKLTFSIDRETGYTLKEFWEPNGGSTYAEEIRENFLPAILDMVLNPESDVIDTEALEEKCLEKAKAYISKFEE